MNVLTIGGAMVDTIVTIASDRIEQMKMLNAESSYLLREEGIKTEADQISTSTGGGAINAAVTAARLGNSTSTIVKLGEDSKARTVLDRLTEEGGGLRIVSSHERNAAVFTYRGANTKLEAADIPAAAFEYRDLVYVANLSNQSADCYPLIVDRAKSAGAKLAVNPGVRQLTARYDDFWESLDQIDVLSINRAEAQALMPRLLQSFGDGGAPLAVHDGAATPVPAKRGLRNGGYEMSLGKFFGGLIKVGVVVAAATTGAGDAFSATFACYSSQTNDVARALSAAALNAASVVKFVDTQSGLLTLQALEAEIESAAATAPSLHSWSI